MQINLILRYHKQRSSCYIKWMGQKSKQAINPGASARCTSTRMSPSLSMSHSTSKWWGTLQTFNKQNGTRELCCARAMQIIRLSSHPYPVQPLIGFSHTRARREPLLVGPSPLCTSAAKETEECLPSVVRGLPRTCSRDVSTRPFQPHDEDLRG